MPRVCVIGAGPAGCVFAARMAQLGHEVTLIERVRFPRTTLGESLTPGVLPLLEMIGAREAIEAAAFTRVRSVTTTWDGEVRQRDDPSESGLLVDRGRFDALLLERARALGVQVLHPATVCERRAADQQWRLVVEARGRRIELEADFLADAGGRRAALPGKRTRGPLATVALYAYWRGTTLPSQPRIDAGADAWYWGVPLPDGRYNTLMFIDSSTLRASRTESIGTLFHRLLGASGLMAHCVDATLDTPVRAVDATPYVDGDCVTASSIKVGDAALAIDPLSSSGVQKAVQTALAGAIVSNTLLRRPESAAAATQFYRTTIEDAAARHRGWAASHYATVAARRGGAFWLARAGESISAGVEPAGAARDGAFEQPTAVESLTGAIALSPLLEFVDLPCIDGELVTTKGALRHPRLESPVAYLGGHELLPLIQSIRTGMTPVEIARSWAGRVSPRSALAIVTWLLEHRVLVPGGSVSSDHASA